MIEKPDDGVVARDSVSDRELAEFRDTVAGVRRGLAQARKGLGRSIDEVFLEIERKGPA